MTMRAALARAIAVGAITPLGQHQVVLGGATVSADVYLDAAGENVHIEIDCNKQTMSTRVGEVSVDGTMHLSMTVQSFQEMQAKLEGYQGKLLRIAEYVTRSAPMLRNRNDGD